ncbi:MAG: phosphoglucosamine mutase [Candidatus Competibacteraceae bacterium]|nr:phosphoglucosamine mutase [Candidatus Competibacteraceae bacterium]MCB1805383.1 phosphoglucosamine mutase [Candidatus Competibacteraceae bacterium]MCB1812672.1 phosphoglucosamine mutase [Candidatus Competibacteraceae bacterium]
MSKQYFGTDGIRGRVGEYPITPDYMLKLGWAVGKTFGQSKGHSKVIIGKDTRISGYMFESALESGLSAAGVDVALLGPMPTPGIAYLTRTLRACAGIVISASHNPHFDNGVKFFSDNGSKLPDGIEHYIEELLAQPMQIVAPVELGKAERIHDAAGRYIEFCKSSVPWNLTFHGLKIVLDCANGATYHIAPEVFSELGAEVIAIGVDPDGLNINHQCGSTHPQSLQSEVLKHQADLGIAFDGDGDRVIMVDEHGVLLDGDELLYIIARDQKLRGIELNAVIGTQMSNLGLENALQQLGIVLHRVKVGDRYILEKLLADKLRLGGESSGHIICLDKATTGDGIIAGLQVLSALMQTQQPLSELKAGMSKYPQHLINVPIANRVDLTSNTRVQQAVLELENQLGRQGRVLLRPSGTEPVVRVMVEGVDESLVRSLAQQLATVVQQAVAN